MISEAAGVVSQASARRIRAVLGISTRYIDPKRPLQLYGINLLSSISLRSWIREALDVDMASFVFMDNATVVSMGMSIRKGLLETMGCSNYVTEKFVS